VFLINFSAKFPRLVKLFFFFAKEPKREGEREFCNLIFSREREREAKKRNLIFKFSSSNQKVQRQARENITEA
jgi:hypothetical protein